MWTWSFTSLGTGRLAGFGGFARFLSSHTEHFNLFAAAIASVDAPLIASALANLLLLLCPVFSWSLFTACWTPLEIWMSPGTSTSDPLSSWMNSNAPSPGWGPAGVSSSMALSKPSSRSSSPSSSSSRAWASFAHKPLRWRTSHSNCSSAPWTMAHAILTGYLPAGEVILLPPITCACWWSRLQRLFRNFEATAWEDVATKVGFMCRSPLKAHRSPNWHWSNFTTSASNLASHLRTSSNFHAFEPAGFSSM